MRSQRIITIFVVFCCISKIFAQESSLYLIAGQGYPSNCADEFSEQYPVHFFRMNKDSLCKVADLASGNESVFKIASYNFYKMAILYKSDLLSKKKTIIQISYDKKIKIDTINREFSESAFLDFSYYIVDIGHPWILFKYYPDFNEKPDSVLFYGINLINKNDSIFTNKVIQHIHSEGEQGIALVGGTSEYSEIVKISNKTSNGKLVQQVIYPRIRSYDTCAILLPNLIQLGHNFQYALLPNKINQFMQYPIFNESIICIYTSSDWDEEKFKGSHNYQIYNKTSNSWENQKFQGLYSSGKRQFDEWLAGYIAYTYHRGFQQKMKKNGIIPGEKYRKKKSLYGSTFNERAKDYQLYPEGILFLYNLKSQIYIEWEALENGEHQGDSEILLVKDEIVYYRINDKIYKVPIINGEKLGIPELLVQDERVPDIHWAFIGVE